ncbi:MAG TPA: type I-MYXAN CRISPR-associated protein Cas6/Cmx6 [Usitatibacter sp.]|nr:type I-MYXAN CRISPR-associated protein Cas6/Cmx6 [Usitatibacter sp.]
MDSAFPIAPDMVDVAFDLAATTLPRDFEWPLFRALAAIAPWLQGAPGAGIHPLHACRADDGSYLVPRRAKLVLRLPRDRLCAASALEDAALDLGAGRAARLGKAAVRMLEPAPTVYSPRVVTGDADEIAFSRRVAQELDLLGIRRPLVCGKRSVVAVDGLETAAFSVAVHGLGEDASLLLQSAGVGRARAIGCGLFVPHKTIHAD